MEKELEMLDPALRDVVARLKAAPSAHVSANFHARVMASLDEHALPGERASRPFTARMRQRRVPLFPHYRTAIAAAASIVLLLGVASLFRQQVSPSASICNENPAITLADGSRPTASVAPYVQSYAVRALVAEGLVHSEALSRAVAEIVRSQNVDGGWGVPALTARNTAALEVAVRAGNRTALCAWKRGVRHLRTHGIPEPCETTTCMN